MTNPTMTDICSDREHVNTREAGFECLDARQAGFARALLDPGCPVPPGLVGPGGRASTKRFNVYRNNVVAGLVATLRDAYPAVARLVGDAFFAAMARIHVSSAPPRSPMMFDYGTGFPDFVGAFEPARSLPYLRDVARIERAWLEAYHAGEARALDPIVLAQVSADDLPNLRLLLHPSHRLVRSRYPSLAIWRTNVEDGLSPHVDLDAGGEDILIIRPEAEVELRLLPPGGAEFVQALADGRTVIEAFETAATADSRFDLPANLSGLIEAHAVVGFEFGPDLSLDVTRQLQ
ncbi:hypothetical protein LMIY3S_03799 [Labrys miyagiensis]